MPVVTDDARFDTSTVVSRDKVDERVFGRTRAKKVPPYIFSVNGNAGLVHKVAYVDLHWYRIASMNRLVRMSRPVMIATTVCQQSWWLKGEKCRTCVLPDKDAILCGRCHGQVASFSKKHNGPFKDLPRVEAHVRLGCVIRAY